MSNVLYISIPHETHYDTNYCILRNASKILIEKLGKSTVTLRHLKSIEIERTVKQADV
jgi:hypothetical protein